MSMCLSNSQHDRNHIACRCVCRTQKMMIACRCVCRTHTIMIACRCVCQTHKMMTIMPICLLHSQDDWNHSRLSLLLACLYLVCRTVTRNQNKMIACRCVCCTHKMTGIIIEDVVGWTLLLACLYVVCGMANKNCAISNTRLNEGTGIREYPTIRPIRHISFQ
jgi:hypothetical protein